jgi:hypothetical protein
VATVPIFNTLFLAVLTKNEDDAGTSDTFNLTVNVAGEDVLDKDFGPDLGDAEADVIRSGTLPAPLDSAGLTNSSIRLGIRDDDAWAPQEVLLFGEAEPDFQPGRMVALAMESDLQHWLSTDSSEGLLTMPVRLVSPGSSMTVIRRVLMLVHTIWSSIGGDTATDSPIELEVRAGGNVVLKQAIHDTAQDDLEKGKTNWYMLDAATPFTRADVLANGGITLRILGSDAWRVGPMFLFGLDTATGRPNAVVNLTAQPMRDLGWMSTDTSEGSPSVEIEVATI